MPTLFVSHGSPMLAVADSAARRFLVELGPRLPQPTAIIVISAHYDTPMTEVTAADKLETIHDFGGFRPSFIGFAIRRVAARRLRAMSPGSSRPQGRMRGSRQIAVSITAPGSRYR